MESSLFLKFKIIFFSFSFHTQVEGQLIFPELKKNYTLFQFA